MIRILIADDHKIFRQGLRELLASEPDCEVVGAASDGAEALSLTNRLNPDLVILDVTMPVLDGFETLRHLRAGETSTKVLILSMHKDSAAVRKAMALGADGFVLKEEAYDELSRAIRSVIKGKRFLSPLALKSLETAEAVKDVDLTPREREIVEAIALGKTTKEIAQELGLSVKTVETHRQRIMIKLDCHKLTEIVRFAIAKGIIKS